MVNTRTPLLAAVESERDPASVAALADLLEEEGDEEAALGLKWGINRGMWPEYDGMLEQWLFCTVRNNQMPAFLWPWSVWGRTWLDAFRSLGRALLACRKETYP